MLGGELKEAAKEGATRLGNVVRKADYGAAIDNLKTLFGFVSRHVKNLAFLDPFGFWSQEKVRVPFMMTQVIDRNQRCEFLPDTGRSLCQYNGQLIVNGRALPMVRLQGEAGGAITMRNNCLYAINTNHQPEALQLLGLNPKKYKNIRLVVACQGSVVLPPPEGDDLRLMRVIRNADIEPETRRIKRETTGRTLWIPTLLVAVPFNICAGLINVGLMIPHGLCNGIKQLVGAAANRIEKKVLHIKVAQARGTVSKPGTYWPWMVIGGACRTVDRTFALVSYALGTARACATCVFRSVPLLMNAALNLSSAQLDIAGCYLKSTASRVGEMWAEFKEENRTIAEFYMNSNAKRDSGVWEKSSSQKGSEREVGTHTSNTTHRTFGQELSPILREKKAGELFTAGLNREAKGYGQELSDLGVYISYGTAKQGKESFADAVRQQSSGGTFVGRR